WNTFSQKSLSRIFSQQEIDYCLQMPSKSAERFAVRFAAREAFFKALSSAQPHEHFSFLTVCVAVSIIKINARPMCIINWQKLTTKIPTCTIHISLTHTNTIASAL